MRVMFALGHPVPFAGAAWTRVHHFASYFSSNESGTVVLAGLAPSNMMKPKKTLIGNVSVLNMLPTIPLEHLSIRWVNILISLMFSWEIILIMDPDMIILSVPPFESTLGVFLACKLLRKKIVIDYRDEWEDYIVSKAESQVSKTAYKILKKLLTLLYIKCDLVVTVTQAFADSLRGRQVEKVCVVPNGADSTIFRPMNKEEARHRIGLAPSDFAVVYSGHVGNYYRLDIAVHALNTFMKRNDMSNAKLVIIGDGPNVKNLLKLASNLGVRKSIMYLGATCDHERVALVISSADVGLIPRDENPLWKGAWPVKFFEYCACGLPVIATVYKDSTLARLIEENNVGLVTSPMDIEALSRAFDKVYFDEDFRRASGEFARRLIEERFRRDELADQLLTLLHGLNSYQEASND